MRAIASIDHQAVSRVISNDLWGLAEKALAHRDLHSGSEHIRHADYRALDDEVRRLVAGTNVVKFKVLTPAGTVVYSTDPDDIGKIYKGSPGLQAALKGESGGKYGLQPAFNGLGGKLQNTWITSNYVTNVAPNTGAVTAIAEIYSDASAKRTLARRAAIENVTIALTTLLVIFALLLAMVYAAVRMVRNEHRRALALTAAMAQAEAASQSKTAFLANMSHELRTPLNAIIGFAEIMGGEIKGPLGDPSYKGYAEDIGKSGRHLLGIIDRVLDLVRAETGAILLDLGPTNVNFVCKSVERMLFGEVENAGLNLSVTTSEDPLTINTDGRKLRDILVGLVSNSIKFTPEGGNVEIRIDRKGKGVRIRIIDDGIGISAEDMPTAAAAFGHVENVYSRKQGGIGLGLPMTRKLTELLDGSFEVASGANQGTVVTLVLPDHPSGLPANDDSDPEAKTDSRA
jgi:signal transduction histidine kinase